MQNNYRKHFSAILFTAAAITAQAQFPNIKLDSNQSYGECSIIINPKNTNQVIGGSNLNNVYRTGDGGATWSKQTVNVSGDNGDPTCAIDTAGNFYFAHLHGAQDGNSCYRSTDGGQTWNFRSNFGVTMGYDDDKEWLLVDWASNSPYKNTMYSTWAEFDNYSSSSPTDSSRILLSKSTDDGLTWSSPVRVSRQGGNCGFYAIKGSVPAVGPNGELYVIWCGTTASASNSNVYFQKSLDGGNTWMMQDKIIDVQVPTWYYTIPGFVYGTGFPGIDCDVSGGPYNGNIYVTWCDQRNGLNNTDVFLAKSSDGGTTWNTIRVNNDVGQTHQSHPWVCVDQTTGVVYMVFYDRRNYNDTRTDVYLAWSTDGGNSFSQVKINTLTAIDPNASSLWTDYIGITAHNNKIHPIWSASRVSDGVEEWTTTIDGTQLVGMKEQQQKNEDELVLYQNYPNPFSMYSQFDFYMSKAASVNLKIYDITGREVASLISGEQFAAGMHNFSVTNDAIKLPAGIYYCVLSTPTAKDTRKFTVTQ
ncbi:MAG TPA: exo-alpha-sialidase [Bacteroidia bacterium]